MKKKKPGNKNHRNNYKWIILIVGLILIIVELIVNDLFIPLIDNIVIKNIVRLGCIFISSVASIFLVSVLWDLYEKKNFSNELLLTIGMSKNVIDSGIVDYDKSSSVNWENFLNTANSFELFLTFGESWVDENGSKCDLISNFISRDKTNMTVILPNYTKDKILDALLIKYPTNHDSDNDIGNIKNKIINTIKGFWEISTKIEIKLYNGINSSSYFFLNDRCFFSPYTHENYKGLSIPIIELQSKGEQSSFYNFCRRDMDNILKNSTSAEDCDEDLKQFLTAKKEENKSN